MFDSADVLAKTDFIFSTSKTSTFKKSTSWNGHFSLGRTVIYNGNANTQQEISDCFSLLWKNIGYDSSGSRIDLKLTCNKLKIKHNKQNTSHTDFPTQTPLIAVSGSNIGAYPEWYWWTSMEFTVNLYKTGTTNPASGSLLTKFYDLDCGEWIGGVPVYTSEWAETIKLISGFGTVYITQNNFLNITDNNTWFRPTKADSNTMDSGFVSTMSNGATFRWTGNNTSATYLLEPFENHYVTASAGTGGTITNNGKKLVGWKTTPQYTATASKYYTVKSITVDGIAQSIQQGKKTASYTFPAVTKDRVISATFERIKTSLTYDKNLSTATGTTPGVTVDAGTNAYISHNGFNADGYMFKEWNTKPDGSGIAYQPEDSIFLEESPVILYAQWTPVLHTVTETHTSGGTVTPSGSTTVNHGDKITWKIQSEPGYKISLIQVNGKPIEITNPSSMEYCILNVSSDSHIHVEFQALPSYIAYFPNAPEGTTVSGTMSNFTGESNAPHVVQDCSFSIQGWTFIGWTTEPSADCNYDFTLPGDEIAFPNPGETTELYAQWEKNPILTIIVEGHGTARISQHTSTGINMDIGTVENDSTEEWTLEPGIDIDVSWNPSSAWYASKVEIDGNLIESEDSIFKNQRWIADDIYEDHVIRITFLPSLDIPETGTNPMLAWIVLSTGTILLTVTLLLIYRRIER